MENQFKMRISRMFRSSFGSCKSKNVINDDVIEKPEIHQNTRPQNHGHHQNFMELFSPNFRCSICRPRCSESFQGCIVTKNNLFPRIISKVVTTMSSSSSERRSLLPESRDNNFFDGQKCPPASPASPCNNNNKLNFFNNGTYYSRHHEHSKPKLKKNNNKNKKKTVKKRVPPARFSGGGILEFQQYPSTTYNYNGLFSSSGATDEEDDKTTLFSSTRSLSSDSSTSLRRRRRRRRRSNKLSLKNSPPPSPPPLPRRTAIRKESSPLEYVKVKDSFAVVKRSKDPYSDFRTSMVEMIIEKQIFSGEDLEKLLQCFLSLNSYHHHKVIIQVFTEIWEALFCNNLS